MVCDYRCLGLFSLGLVVSVELGVNVGVFEPLLNFKVEQLRVGARDGFGAGGISVIEIKAARVERVNGLGAARLVVV